MPQMDELAQNPSMERIDLPPISLEHRDGEIVIRHQSGLTTTIKADKLASFAMTWLRKELTLPDSSVAAVDSQAAALK